MKHMAVGSLTPNIGIAWPIATDEKNNAKTHRKSLQHIIASAIALMAVVETVPKADIPIVAVRKAERKNNIVHIVRMAVVIVAVDSRRKVAAIKHPRPGAKYSANNGKAMLIAKKNSNKG